MDINKSMRLTKFEFEKCFTEKNYYEMQTVNNKQLNLLINMVDAQENDTIIDLGTGSGYVAFSIAEKYNGTNIIGLDIVTETLKRNTQKAIDNNFCNLRFVSYDGSNFPFSDNSVDKIITRYALHHFPELKESLKEIYRILKPNGKLIISDPTPNDNDTNQFVDRFMQMKADGHIKFYHINEYKEMLKSIGFHFVLNETTNIRFPRKEAEKYSELIAKTDKNILSGYEIEIKGDEIWITEKVLNMIFVK